MGWLVRFIHNRDLAVENIVTAYIRQCMVMSAPVRAHEELFEKVTLGSIRLSPGSLLMLATEIPRSTPGMFEVSVERTKRNSSTVRSLPDSVQLQIKALCSAASPALRAPRFSEGVVQMDKGVSINGRSYHKGVFCEVVQRIPRSQSAAANAPRFFCVGVIDLFYVVKCGTGTAMPDEVFVVVREVEVLGKYRSLYIRKRPTEDDPPLPVRIIHVDSITRRIHFVPHFSDADKECGIPVWDAK